MIGVSYDVFWTLNPKSLSHFIKAFEYKQAYDDTLAWQQGNYIRLAIASVMAKNAKYPEHPASHKPKQITQHDIKAKFLNHVAMINSNFVEEE